MKAKNQTTKEKKTCLKSKLYIETNGGVFVV